MRVHVMHVEIRSFIFRHCRAHGAVSCQVRTGGGCRLPASLFPRFSHNGAEIESCKYIVLFTTSREWDSRFPSSLSSISNLESHPLVVSDWQLQVKQAQLFSISVVL